MGEMMKFLCARRKCARQLSKLLTLNVKDVGTVVCQPWEDPADAVENFALRASQAGHGMTEESMQQMHNFFCERRRCARQLSSKLTLNMKGLGTLVVLPWEDPADSVENFAAQAVTAGIEVGAPGMKQMMEFFCARRSCNRMQLNVPSSAASSTPAATSQ